MRYCTALCLALGAAAWALPAPASAAVIGKAVVTAEKASVMQGKEAVASVKKGDVLDVTEMKGDWFGVAPTRGWIHKSNVRFEAAAAPTPAAPAAPAANQPPPPAATATHTFSGYLERGFMLGGGGEIPKCLDPSRRWVRVSPEQEVVGRKVLAAVSANSGNLETIAFMALSVSQAMRQTVEGKPTADMLHIVAMSRKDLPATGIFKDPIRFQPGPVTTVAAVCKQFGAATEKETWSGKSFQDMGMSDTVWWWGQVGVAASADGTITHILVRRPVEEAK